MLPSASLGVGLLGSDLLPDRVTVGATSTAVMVTGAAVATLLSWSVADSCTWYVPGTSGGERGIGGRAGCVVERGYAIGGFVHAPSVGEPNGGVVGTVGDKAAQGDRRPFRHAAGGAPVMAAVGITSATAALEWAVAVDELSVITTVIDLVPSSA